MSKRNRWAAKSRIRAVYPAGYSTEVTDDRMGVTVSPYFSPVLTIKAPCQAPTWLGHLIWGAYAKRGKAPRMKWIGLLQ